MRRRMRFIFLGPGRGDFDTQRNRMIASGAASETDRFVSFCWKSYGL